MFRDAADAALKTEAIKAVSCSRFDAYLGVHQSGPGMGASMLPFRVREAEKKGHVIIRLGERALCVVEPRDDRSCFLYAGLNKPSPTLLREIMESVLRHLPEMTELRTDFPNAGDETLARALKDCEGQILHETAFGCWISVPLASGSQRPAVHLAATSAEIPEVEEAGKVIKLERRRWSHETRRPRARPANAVAGWRPG